MSNTGTSNYFVHTLLLARDWQHRPQLDAVIEWWADGGRGVCALVGMGDMDGMDGAGSMDGASKTAIADRFLNELLDNTTTTHERDRRPEPGRETMPEQRERSQPAALHQTSEKRQPATAAPAEPAFARSGLPHFVDASDSITVTYDRQAGRTSVTDQRGTVHEYLYDKLGRLTTDAVTTPGTGVDQSVLRLSWQYDVRGLLEKATSYDNPTAGSVTNQVQWSYNDFGQVTTSYQAHSGAVNTGTSPKVQYAYADGSDNTLRPVTLTYPDGRVISYTYGTSSGMDDQASRVAGIKDGTTTLAGYTYLGLGSVVEVDYTEPDVQYDLIGSGSYAGLDQFNRIVDSRWKKSSTDVDRVQYGYDRASNRTYREVPTDSSHSFDELYSQGGPSTCVRVVQRQYAGWPIHGRVSKVREAAPSIPDETLHVIPVLHVDGKSSCRSATRPENWPGHPAQVHMELLNSWRMSFELVVYPGCHSMVCLY